MIKEGRAHSIPPLEDTVHGLMASYILKSLSAYKVENPEQVMSFYMHNLKRAFEQEGKFNPLKLIPYLRARHDSRTEKLAALIVKDFYIPSY